MPCFVTSNIMNEIHVTQDVEIALYSYDTCSKCFG